MTNGTLIQRDRDDEATRIITTLQAEKNRLANEINGTAGRPVSDGVLSYLHGGLSAITRVLDTVAPDQLVEKKES